MKCPRCQADNRDGARFCRECGATFAAVCPSCGAKVEPGSKFCDSCGAALAAAPTPPAAASRFASPEAYTPKHLAERILTSKSALEGERKQVTVLFADLKGSMELLADRDPEEARKLLDPVLERMMEAVHRYEGTVNQVMGDGIMALFGAPVALEDHAVRACYAALRMQDSVRQYAEGVRRDEGISIQIRVGVNSGDVVVRSIGSDLRMDYTAVGQTTHLAARMEQLAAPGSIVLAPETLRLAEGYVAVKSLGPVKVKGMSEPVDVYQVMSAGAVRTRHGDHIQGMGVVRRRALQCCLPRCQRMPYVDCPTNIQTLSQPAWTCRPRMEPEPARPVLSSNGRDRIGRHCCRGRDCGQDAAVGSTEVERAIGLSVDPVTLLVHSAVGDRAARDSRASWDRRRGAPRARRSRRPVGPSRPWDSQ